MKRGFTLVELLVVMGVVALLIALVVPAYQIVIARADSAKCLGNLKELGTALSTYLSDNQMTMPPLAAGRASLEENIPVIDNTLDRYLSTKAVFACPEDRLLSAKSGTSYYWNSALSGQRTANLNMLGLLKDHSAIPVIVDKEGWHRYSDDRVNHLFADGHAATQFRLFTGTE